MLSRLCWYSGDGFASDQRLPELIVRSGKNSIAFFCTGIVGVDAPKYGGGSPEAIADMLLQLKTALT